MTREPTDYVHRVTCLQNKKVKVQRFCYIIYQRSLNKKTRTPGQSRNKMWERNAALIKNLRKQNRQTRSLSISTQTS